MKNYDFGGYATKNDLRCSDGRTIRRNAFKDCDGQTVPLVYQHLHDDVENVLGHAMLENRDDGVYAYCSLNDTDMGKHARMAIQHGDLTSLSIYANKLVHNGDDVIHGVIREVSLVLAGANPGAFIDNLAISHADGSYTEAEDEAVIYTGLPLRVNDLSHAEEAAKSGGSEGRTIQDVVDSMSEEQKNVLYFLVGQALEDSGGEMAQDAFEDDNYEGGSTMHKNVFDGTAANDKEKTSLSHAEMKAIMDEAQKCGSFKQAVLAHAATYGIDNIEILFPDAKNVTTPPDWIKRRTEWVSSVINGARHSPFSRIKTQTADITADEARARGYIKGNQKVEEVFPVMQRVTTPTTIYKKQKLDRDDIIDITDFSVVAWIRQEMRVMLDEEIARAVLVGDGRSALGTDGKPNPDKINEENIRPIWKENDLYCTKVQLDATAKTEEIMDGIIRAMDEYEGSGSPTMFCTQSFVTDMLLLRDSIGRRLYESEASITNFLGVSNIVKVPIMKGLSREDSDGNTMELKAILVNMSDYTIGADKGGEITSYDDFDIDYNQYKYLLETRLSGALIHPKTAVVVELKTPKPTPGGQQAAG